MPKERRFVGHDESEGITVHIGTLENHIAPDVSVHHCIVSLHRDVAALH